MILNEIYQQQPDGTFLGSDGKVYKQTINAEFIETTPPTSIFTTISKVYLAPHVDGEPQAVNAGATITIKTSTTLTPAVKVGDGVDTPPPKASIGSSGLKQMLANLKNQSE